MTNTLKLSQLRLAPLNARKVAPSAAGIEQLAADIAAHGVIQSLAVYKEGRHFHVFAGGRRWRALNRLLDAKIITADYEVPVVVREKAEAVELSYTENAQREAMHHADAIRAFATLRDEGGMGAADIAVRFGYSEGHVKKLLTLGSLAPSLLDAMAEDCLGLEAARVLTITADPVLQEQLFERYGNNPHRIRNALTEEKVSIKTALFVYVGKEAYEAAGGTITTDLFAKEGEGYADNANLLNELAEAKLAGVEQGLRDLGWKTVEVSTSRPDNLYHRPSLAAIEREPSAEEAAEIERITDEITQLEVSAPDGEEIADLHDMLDNIQDRLKEYPADLRAQHGAVAYISYQGELTVHYVRLPTQEDEEAAKAAKAAKGDDGPYSKALVEQLTGIRSLALQETVANNPTLALDILLDTLTGQMLHGIYSYRFPTQISFQRHSPAVDDDLMTNSTITRVDDLVAERFADIPADTRFATIQSMEQGDKMQLLAAIVASSLNATIANGYSDSDKIRMANAYGEAGSMEISNVWAAPTELFGRIRKGNLLAILKDACGAEAAENCAKMKQAELMTVMADRLPADWRPAPLLNGGLVEVEEPAEDAEGVSEAA